MTTRISAAHSLDDERAALYGRIAELELREARRARELEVVSRIGQALVRSFETQAIIELVGEALRETFVTQNISIALYDRENNLLTYFYALNDGQHVSPGTIPLSESPTSRIIESRQPFLFTTEAERQAAEQPDTPIGTSTHSYLGVPIMFGD